MRKQTFINYVLLSSIALFFLIQGVPLLPAQYGSNSGSTSPMYNPTTETTVSGVVEEVQEVSGTRGWHGIHLQLKTADEVLDVHIGPSWFLAQKKFEISKGAQVEVTGSKLRLDNVDTLIARMIKKGDSELTLRNRQGIPAWSRGQRP
ncbi:MAG: hypothetical protein WCE63_19195 [Acidobacteriaceae bacterium]